MPSHSTMLWYHLYDIDKLYKSIMQHPIPVYWFLRCLLFCPLGTALNFTPKIKEHSVISPRPSQVIYNSTKSYITTLLIPSRKVTAYPATFITQKFTLRLAEPQTNVGGVRRLEPSLLINSPTVQAGVCVICRLASFEILGLFSWRVCPHNKIETWLYVGFLFP